MFTSDLCRIVYMGISRARVVEILEPRDPGEALLTLQPMEEVAYHVAAPAEGQFEPEVKAGDEIDSGALLGAIKLFGVHPEPVPVVNTGPRARVICLITMYAEREQPLILCEPI